MQAIDLRDRRISVIDLQTSEEASTSVAPAKEVLLGHDILDSLILDLQNRRATRANDLWLEEEKASLCCALPITSLAAILRRLTGGLYGPVAKSALYDWKYVEFLRGDPVAVRNGEGYHLRVARLPPGEIARLTDMLPYLHASELITLLPDEKAVDTFEARSAERQLQVFEELEEEQAIALLPDVVADLVGRLSTKEMSLPQQATRSPGRANASSNSCVTRRHGGWDLDQRHSARACQPHCCVSARAFWSSSARGWP